MKKYLVAYILCVVVGPIVACTDTDRASILAYGEAGTITCYSGGVIILNVKSTGRIQTVKNSDGWEFQEEGTDNFIRVSGTCVVRN